MNRSTSESLFTGKERDAETGLDFFDVRYLSGAQGRFTSPDEPLTFADPENPQTWNLYSYGLNNPLLYSDPSGHDPCVNGVNPQSGNICTTGTSTAPGLDPIQELILGRLTNTLITMNRVAEKTQQLAQPVMDWLSQPRNQNCLNAATASGVAAGATYGLVSAAGGPTVLIGDPAAAGIGGGIGWVGGMFSCTTGSGGGGSAGGSQGRSTAGSMQKQVERGQAPKSVDRVDRARFPHEKDQVHFKDGSALNFDGTWKHGGRALTGAERDWLSYNGWSAPR